LNGMMLIKLNKYRLDPLTFVSISAKKKVSTTLKARPAPTLKCLNSLGIK
jgi:hypothetical protein